MKTFQLVRVIPGHTAATQVTGIVAEATVFSDGLAVLHWLTDPAGTEVYPAPHGEELMREVRESSGRSQFHETGRRSLQAAPGYLEQDAASGSFGTPASALRQAASALRALQAYGLLADELNAIAADLDSWTAPGYLAQGGRVTTPGGADRGDLP